MFGKKSSLYLLFSTLDNSNFKNSAISKTYRHRSKIPENIPSSSPSRIGKEKNSRNGKDDTGTSGMEKILARPRNGFQPLALIYPVFRI